MTRPYNTRSVRDMNARMADAMTSFDELSVVSPSMIIDLKSVYPISRLRDSISVEAGGDVTQGDGSFSVTTSSDPDSMAILRSVERARYIAGYEGLPGQAIRVVTEPTGDQEAEWGNTDFVNGFSVGIDAQGMFTRLYSGGEIIEEQRREEWNYPLYDELDPYQSTIYRMPYRWYGAGPYRLQISDVDDKGRGLIRAATNTRHDPVDGAITEDPNQPIAVRVRNNGTGAPMDVRVMGRQYFIQGDYNPNRRVIGDYRIEQTVDTTWTPLIVFQQKLGAYESISTKIAGAEVLSTENLIWMVRTFPTITGGTWGTPPDTDGGVETSVDSNISATGIEGGIQTVPPRLAPGGGGNRSGLSSEDVPDTEVPAGQPIALCARAVSASSTVTSTFRVREEW